MSDYIYWFSCYSPSLDDFNDSQGGYEFDGHQYTSYSLDEYSDSPGYLQWPTPCPGPVLPPLMGPYQYSVFDLFKSDDIL